MSRSLLLALLFTAAALAGPAALAQVCSGNVTLSSQAEVDAFDCVEVTGSLTISGDEITDLSPLSGLTSISDLVISYNAALTSLAGLENLTTVGGSLHIEGNDVLASLTGLEGVTTLDMGLRVIENDLLTSLVGLKNLTSVSCIAMGWCTSLAIYGNDALASLHGLERLTSAGHDYTSQVIQENSALTSLSGLESLTSVRNLIIADNVMLVTLAALGGLTSLRNLHIEGNAALTSLAGLEGLTHISNQLSISSNAMLSDCACGLSGLISGDPPAFIGFGAPLIIESNAAGGLCTSPQVVLDASVDAVCMPVANEPAPGVPDRFALAPPYPNPFRGTATVSFAVPVTSDVRLIVYDVLGREVAVLLDGPVAAAHHEVALDGSRLPSGTYLVRMTAEGGFTQTQRMTVMR